MRSNPFDLTISDIPDNIDDRLRSSYYAGNGALHDQEDNFEVYEDVPDAEAYVPTSRRPRFLSALTRCFGK